MTKFTSEESILSGDRDEKIRERAYAIWLDQGSVQGRDREHWLEAEKEIAREETPAEANGDGKIASAQKAGTIPTDRLNASNDE